MLHKLLFTLLLLCVLFYGAFPAQAQNPDIQAFAKLPILHEGRVKPMDSFAQSKLKLLSGSKKDAMPWLIETLFNPANAENFDVIKLSNPDVLNMLEIERQESKLYSYKEISEALRGKQEVLFSILNAPEEDWSLAQRDFVLLQQKTVMLGDILASMSLFLPLSVSVPEKLKTEPLGDSLTYLDISKFKETLQKETLNILKSKGESLETYTPDEQEIVLLSFTNANLQAAGERSQVFRVIPSSANQSWISPWQSILGQGSPETTELFNAWKELAHAYHQNDAKRWNTIVNKIQSLTHNLGKNDIRSNALKLEYLYNQVQPYVLSFWLYGLCLCSLLISFAMRKNIVVIPLTLLCAGAFIHLGGITARVFILERPPVSTLYESIIFVALSAVLYGLLMFVKHREKLWLYLGAGCGLFLTMVSFTHNQEGDSFLMLTAVLNTNFWLATHVICITLGYAFCLITSVLAHIILIRPENTILRHLNTTALLALLFSTVGTVLGGIWADQSWGRFWGWDPKENGALLIVLWLIWLIHGRISGSMKNWFVHAGLAYLSVIVALSWFGVNLLSVGLHAYGFTDSAALGLGIFVGLETLLIISLVLYKNTYRHAA